MFFSKIPAPSPIHLAFNVVDNCRTSPYFNFQPLRAFLATSFSVLASKINLKRKIIAFPILEKLFFNLDNIISYLFFPTRGEVLDNSNSGTAEVHISTSHVFPELF